VDDPLLRLYCKYSPDLSVLHFWIRCKELSQTFDTIATAVSVLWTVLRVFSIEKYNSQEKID